MCEIIRAFIANGKFSQITDNVANIPIDITDYIDCPGTEGKNKILKGKLKFVLLLYLHSLKRKNGIFYLMDKVFHLMEYLNGNLIQIKYKIIRMNLMFTI